MRCDDPCITSMRQLRKNMSESLKEIEYMTSNQPDTQTNLYDTERLTVSQAIY